MGKISLENVSKDYQLRDGSTLEVLDDVSLEIADGEFVSIVGPSGCGKSTILNLIAGLEDPDGGTISTDFEGASDRIGFVFQDPTLLNWRTVDRNLTVALEGMGIPEERHDAAVERTLEMVGLSDFRDQYPLSLSGGMQQRVGLARAFCVEPEVLLMDEPFGSLDEITARGLRKDLLEIWGAESQTILFVTHDINEAVFMSDRVITLSTKPTRIIESFDIEMDRPRSPENAAILDYEERVLDSMTIETEMGM